MALSSRSLTAALLFASFASIVLAQDITVVTNTPVAPAVTVIAAPALPQMTIPKPAEVTIPTASDIPTSTAMPSAHPQPILPPTGKMMISKSMQSGPGGMQDKLNAIVAPPALTNANAAAPAVATPSTISSPTGQSNVWEKSTPSMDGIHYHW